MNIKSIAVFFILSAALFAQQENQKNFFELQQTLELKKENINSEQYMYPSTERKNPALAILYSALLPGMGELYAGDYSLGKYLTATEAGLWIAYFSINMYGEWQVDNFKAYARSNAGVTPDGKDDDFYANVSNYLSVEQYNDEQAFYRRFDEMYNTTTHHWNWEGTTERRTYRSMWVSSRQAFNNLRFVVAGMLLNRLGSIINAVRLVSAHNKNLNVENKVEVNFLPELSPIGQESYRLELQFRF